MVDKIEYLVQAINATIDQKFDFKSAPEAGQISDWGTLVMARDALNKLKTLVERGVVVDNKGE